MTSDIVQQLVDKTYRELAQANKPKERTRISTTPNGYIFLVAWSNASLLRVLNRKFTDSLPKNEYRLKAQSNDSCRSVVANIEEGFARQTTSEYINFLGGCTKVFSRWVFEICSGIKSKGFGNRFANVA